jgi:hypothetical protein
MRRVPFQSCLLACLAVAGCASTDEGGIPAAQRAMLEAEAKAGMDRAAGGPGAMSVDAMLANIRAGRSVAAGEVRFRPGDVTPSQDALAGLLASRPTAATVGRISVGGSAGQPPVEGAALALRRGRALSTALGEPGATLAYDPKLPADTARVDWLTTETQGG